MSDLPDSDRRGLRDFFAWIIDGWHRCALGSRVSSLLEDVANHRRTSRLKSRLKSCGKNVTFQWPVVLESPGQIEIGNDVSLTAFVHIWGAGGVRIGDRALIASHVAITSITHDYTAAQMRYTVVLKPVTIEADAWIGTHATIMPGITIGAGAVIGAGCVVTHDVAPRTIVVGVPGRVVGVRPEVPPKAVADLGSGG
jgi:acetyltransferase-like isoleucine patch superfamily enzyme